jgi:phage terminase small subunit
MSQALTSTERVYGPKMRALNQMQRDFVDAMLDTGGINYTECVRRAGSKANSNQAMRQLGSNYARHEGVLAAIREEAVKRLNSASIMAVSVVLEIAADSQTKPELRLKAATEIMNRTGMISVTGHMVQVDTPADVRGKIERIMVLAERLGLDDDAKAKLLGQTPVDVEFEEVEDAEPTEPEQTA